MRVYGGDANISDLGTNRRNAREKHVLGLEVAVDDAHSMQGGQPARNIQRDTLPATLPLQRPVSVGLQGIA